jgi:hypothetical protein
VSQHESKIEIILIVLSSFFLQNTYANTPNTKMHINASLIIFMVFFVLGANRERGEKMRIIVYTPVAYCHQCENYEET